MYNHDDGVVVVFLGDKWTKIVNGIAQHSTKEPLLNSHMHIFASFHANLLCWAIKYFIFSSQMV